MSRRKRKAWKKKRDHTVWIRLQDNDAGTEFIFVETHKGLTRKFAREIITKSGGFGFITKDIAARELKEACQVLQIEGPTWKMAKSFLSARNRYYSRIEDRASRTSKLSKLGNLYLWIDYPANNPVWNSTSRTSILKNGALDSWPP